MFYFVTVVHVVLCVFMIFVILLQPGKDAGMGATLGGGSATSAFGGRGAVTFLSKVTGVCAALFFMTSLGLSFVGLKSSVASGVSAPAATAPTPGQAAAATDAGVVEAAAPAQGVPAESATGATGSTAVSDGGAVTVPVPAPAPAQ